MKADTKGFFVSYVQANMIDWLINRRKVLETVTNILFLRYPGYECETFIF